MNVIIVRFEDIFSTNAEHHCRLKICNGSIVGTTANGGV
jgi:hypothetical protein